MIRNNENASGSLYVRVSTANEALPIAGAVVRIYEYNGENEQSNLIATLLTEQNGITPLITLPTLPAAESLTPDNKRPYYSYNIETVSDGYYRVLDINVPIFNGITSIQPVALIPISEFSDEYDSGEIKNNTIVIIEGEVLSGDRL